MSIELVDIDVALEVVTIHFVTILIKSNLLDGCLFGVKTSDVTWLSDPRVESSIFNLVEFPEAQVTFLVSCDEKRKVRV